MPYLCGFESQITGRLSPWCNVFTDHELRQYSYAQDLRYYYGLGPGTDLEQTMMTPYLNSLVGLLADGPGQNGTAADGGSFKVPDLLVTFINDGQLVELITATGLFDDEPALSGEEITPSRFVASHFVTMRGTIAFERLNCAVEEKPAAVPRGLVSRAQYAYAHQGNGTNNATSTGSGSGSGPSTGSSGSSTNATYIRIKLNDAVYTLPSCQDGPGKSCLLSEYVEFLSARYAAEGSWTENCNATAAAGGAPPTTVLGASFYTDLASPWLQELPPY